MKVTIEVSEGMLDMAKLIAAQEKTDAVPAVPMVCDYTTSFHTLAQRIVAAAWRQGDFVEVRNDAGDWETGVVAYVDTTGRRDETELLVWVANEDLDVTDAYYAASEVRRAERPEWWPTW